jgi:hypothetical protein
MQNTSLLAQGLARRYKLKQAALKLRVSLAERRAISELAAAFIASEP